MTRADRRRLYGSAPWRRVRRQVLERDGRRCQRCGAPGRLEVHHRTPLGAGGDPFDVANLQSLCRKCHFIREPARCRERLIWREAIDAEA